MIRSMTAFGRASENIGGLLITVEMRSVNNRFLDCNVKLPRRWSFLEEKVKPYLISRGITRGKIDISVLLEGTGESASLISIDEEYARGYINALYDLRDMFGLKDDITVTSVARNGDVFKTVKPEEDENKDAEMLLTVLGHATDAFLAARRAEGQRISADLSAKIDGIAETVDKIEKLSAGDTTEHMAKLKSRISSLLDECGVEVDESRLLNECAIYADKIAIDEEIVRLRSHFVAFKDFLASDDAVGRSIDFLLQEMNREINTTGSKCCNAEIARLVVDVKTELEKIREQIQNIE